MPWGFDLLKIHYLSLLPITCNSEFLQEFPIHRLQVIRYEIRLGVTREMYCPVIVENW